MRNLVKQYKKLCDNGYDSSFLYWAPIFIVFTIIMISTAVVVVVNSVFFEKSVTTIFATLVCASATFAGLLYSTLTYGRKMFCKKTNIYYKMDKIFKGSLSELFDINDESVKFVLKNFKNQIETGIYKNNGLHRDLLTSLINQISIRETEQRIIEKEKEEKEALINGNTKTGRMLEELRTINS